MSLTKNDVECLFGQSKEALQHMYTSGAQQALSSAGFMKAANMMLLQAFTIYLVSYIISKLASFVLTHVDITISASYSTSV